MRLDKFLKNARIIKRRTLAKEVCDGGKVIVNGKVGKAGLEVKVGDLIELKIGPMVKKLQVLEIVDNPSKEKAQEMYKEL